MNEERKVAHAVPTEDDSQNFEGENGANPTREVDRKQTDNFKNSERGSVIVQSEKDFDHSFRQGDTLDFLKQSTHSEGSINFLNVNHGSENNSFSNDDSNTRSDTGNPKSLSHNINDLNRQTDISRGTAAVGVEGHIEGLEMTDSHDLQDYVELSNIATCFPLAEEDNAYIENCSIFTENEAVFCEQSESNEDSDINFLDVKRDFK